MPVILGFRDKGTEDVFDGLDSRAARRRCPATLWRIARRKLDVLNAAKALGDIRSLPRNRLELLKGYRKGQYSIRINDQYRICFFWTAEGPSQVEITDYH